jgi:hypothetical protein
VANVRVAHDRNAVERDLATARVAATRVSEHLAAGNIEALDADLELLARAGTQARAGSVGFRWAVADQADLVNRDGREIRGLRRDTVRIAALATAARSLRSELAPLQTRTDTPGTTGSTLYALDDLARGLSRYATAARRATDPSAPTLEHAALAAGLLPTLAGEEGPRVWTVCRETTGPCGQIKVADGRSEAPVASAAPGTASPPGRRWGAATDVLVIGVHPDELFQHPGRFDAAAIFDLLYGLGSGARAGDSEVVRGPRIGPPVTIRSVVGPEQLAINQLSHH